MPMLGSVHMSFPPPLAFLLFLIFFNVGALLILLDFKKGVGNIWQTFGKHSANILESFGLRKNICFGPSR